MIIDTANIGGILIPYSEIVSYSVVYKPYIYRPLFMEKSNFLEHTLSPQKYVFSRMIPYAALITEKEYYQIETKGSKPSGYTAKENTAFAFSLIKDQVVDYVTKDSIVAKGVALAVDLTTELISEKIQNSDTENICYFIQPNGTLGASRLSMIPPLLYHNNGTLTEPKKMRSKKSLPKGYSASVQQVSSLYLITRRQKYLFIGNGIDIESAEQIFNALSIEIARRRPNYR